MKSRLAGLAGLRPQRGHDDDHDEAWRVVRRRIIRETNDYLTACLKHPELGVAIPFVPAKEARFSRRLAEQFWSQVLPQS